MLLASLGKSPLPFDMFAVAQDAATAKRQDRLQSIYHRGQALAWDGQTVLSELLQKHGGIKLRQEQRVAMGSVIRVLM